MSQSFAKRVDDHGDLIGLSDDDHTQYQEALVSDGLEEVVSGFTNTAFADLDALSTDSFSRGVSVTVETGTSALVIISSTQMRINTSGTNSLCYRVSGATTAAASVTNGIRTDFTTDQSQSVMWIETGLTAGSNTFELQAKVTANSGVIRNPTIAVIPLR